MMRNIRAFFMCLSGGTCRHEWRSSSLMSAGYKRYVLAVVTAVYMLNLVDRALMILLLQSIKEDLRLSDTQLGLLTGIAFGLFYATVGLPIARWADRGNRVTITSLAIGFWGLTVMACLFVSNYVQMVFARIAAAVGEAGCKPPTYSLVATYFPSASESTRAMSIYWLGGPLSSLVSYILGGWLNQLCGWRITFLLMGIPGLILAVIVKLTIVEPRAQLTMQQSPREESLPSFRNVLGTLWRGKSCRHLVTALILFYTIGFGLSPWYAAFLVRSHGMGTAELGGWFGLIFGLGGIVGTLAGGYVSGRWFADDERGQMRMTAVSVAALLPCFMAFLLLPGKYLSLAALVPLILAFTFLLAPVYSLLQRLVVDQMRATALAVVMLLANLIGMGLGPQIVGILSDLLAPALAADSLRYAMLAMSFVAVWAAYEFWRVGNTIKQDLLAMTREGSRDLH